MGYASVFTAVTGATYTAAQFNTYTRDNFAAVWVYTTAGDMVYAASSTTLSRLGKPSTSADYYLHMTNAGVPTWQLGNQITGVLNNIGSVDWSPGSPQAFSGSWADISGATKTMVLAAGTTYRIVIIANVKGYNDTDGRTMPLRGVVAGTPDSGTTPGNGGSTSNPRNEALPYIYTVGGVASGSVVCKLQCAGDGGSTSNVSSGRMIVLAFAE